MDLHAYREKIEGEAVPAGAHRSISEAKDELQIVFDMPNDSYGSMRVIMVVKNIANGINMSLAGDIRLLGVSLWPPQQIMRILLKEYLHKAGLDEGKCKLD